MRVLLPIPCEDFDPTEAAVPWKVLSAAGIEVVVATPDGAPAAADPIVLNGDKLGILKAVLRTDANGREAYATFHAEVCGAPAAYKEMKAEDFDALILPGGHAPKMRSYLESTTLRSIIENFFATDKLVGAICHGVVAACRALGPEGKSVLHGRRTTALTEDMELFAWKRTRKTLGDYYRTYPQTVQGEVEEAIGSEGQFLCGPRPLLRDSPTKLSRGFVVEDGNYISARYPGDVHRFSQVLLERLQAASS